MEADLIDEFRFLVHPVIMGEGERFLTDGMATTKLELVKSEQLDLGVTLQCDRSNNNSFGREGKT